MNKIILGGYSGQALVAADILLRSGYTIEGYLEPQEKKYNPLGIKWLGDDRDEIVLQQLRGKNFFAAVGNNLLRKNLNDRLIQSGLTAVNAVDPSAVISPLSRIKELGILIGPRVVINALSV